MYHQSNLILPCNDGRRKIRTVHQTNAVHEARREHQAPVNAMDNRLLLRRREPFGAILRVIIGTFEFRAVRMVQTFLARVYLLDVLNHNGMSAPEYLLKNSAVVRYVPEY